MVAAGRRWHQTADGGGWQLAQTDVVAELAAGLTTVSSRQRHGCVPPGAALVATTAAAPAASQPTSSGGWQAQGGPPSPCSLPPPPAGKGRQLTAWRLGATPAPQHRQCLSPACTAPTVLPCPQVKSTKMNRTIVVRRDYLHFIKKYQVGGSRGRGQAGGGLCRAARVLSSCGRGGGGQPERVAGAPAAAPAGCDHPPSELPPSRSHSPLAPRPAPAPPPPAALREAPHQHLCPPLPLLPLQRGRQRRHRPVPVGARRRRRAAAGLPRLPGGRPTGVKGGPKGCGVLPGGGRRAPLLTPRPIPSAPRPPPAARCPRPCASTCCAWSPRAPEPRRASAASDAAEAQAGARRGGQRRRHQRQPGVEPPRRAQGARGV